MATNGTCSVNVAGVTYSIVSSNYVNFTLSAGIAAGSAVELTFNEVTNPDQAVTITSLQVFTYYDAGLDSIVDGVTENLTLTAVAR